MRAMGTVVGAGRRRTKAKVKHTWTVKIKKRWLMGGFYYMVDCRCGTVPSADSHLQFSFPRKSQAEYFKRRVAAGKTDPRRYRR